MRFSHLYLGLAFGVVLAGQAYTPALAQSADVQNRLSRIENELDTLNRAVYRGERPPASARAAEGASAPADTEVRFQQMEGEIRDMRGMLEEQGHQLRQLSEKLELMNADLQLSNEPAPSGRAAETYTDLPADEAIYVAPQEPGAAQSDARNLTQTLATERPASGAYTAEQLDNILQNPTQKQLGTLTQDESGTVAASSDPASALYENAFAKLKAGSFDTAERDFQKFLNENPDHELTPNAQYWLGETYYVRGDFERAARLFAEGFQKYPKGSKVADNLLKLGMSLAGMGNKADACVALSQLEDSKFKNAANVQRRAVEEMSRIGCS